MAATKYKRKRIELVGNVDFVDVATIADVTGIVDDVDVAGVVGDGEEVTRIKGEMNLTEPVPRPSGGVDIECARG